MLPSASKLDRAFICLASAVLPRTDSATPQANRGKALHAFFADLQTMDADAALARVPEEYRGDCQAIDVDQVPRGAEFDPELALVYDVESEKVRVVGHDVGGNYGQLAPTEIPMQLDLAAVGSDFVATYDFKTGRGYVPSARRNWQLKVAALALARLSGKDNARIAILKAIDGDVAWDAAELDGFDLDTIAADLRILAKRIAIEREHLADMKEGASESKSYPLRAVTGEHCRYCPSFTHCPAQTSIIRRVAGDPEGVVKDTKAMLTPETAARAYERIKLVREVMKQAESALYAYASENPIQLSDGRVFGPVERSTEELDVEVVRTVLAELHGADIADKACTFETSKAGIERAVRTVYERLKQAGEAKTLKELNTTALAVVRDRGGSKTKTRSEIREHKA